MKYKKILSLAAIYVIVLLFGFTLTVMATDATDCVNLVSSGHKGLSYWTNSCNEKVYVQWFDGYSCRTGCLTGISAYGKESTNEPKGNYTYAACFAPQVPTGWSGRLGEGFSCR